jgi:hypothetical protein
MFRVLQFNMQFGMGWNAATPDNAPDRHRGDDRGDPKHNPDVVLLQEVEHAQPGGVQIEPPPNYTRMKEALTGVRQLVLVPQGRSARAAVRDRPGDLLEDPAAREVPRSTFRRRRSSSSLAERRRRRPTA